MEGSGDNFLNNSNQCVRESQFGPVKQEQDAKKMKQRIRGTKIKNMIAKLKPSLERSGR